MQVFEGSEATLKAMSDKDVKLHDGEGVVYIKTVLLKPATIKDGDLINVVQNAPSVVLCGQLDKIKSQINEWLSQSIEEYVKNGD